MMPIKMVGKEIAIRETERGIEGEFRRFIVGADQAIVSRTPVDTGRARGGWIMSFGSFRPTPSTSTGRPNTSRGNAWTVGKGNVFIHNSVEYIVFLDEGSSPQAPQGILDPAVASVAGRFG